MEWLETPLQTLLGLSPATCKQMLEPKYLQKHVRNKPANKPWIRKQSKIEIREMKWLETTLQTLLGLAPATCKQMLELKYLEKHVR